MRNHEEWTAYICSPPPKHALVRFWNELNGRKWTGRASELNPKQGVTYLWYKITGIEKEFQSRPAEFDYEDELRELLRGLELWWDEGVA